MLESLSSQIVDKLARSNLIGNAKIIKLNYKCPKGTVLPDSFECPDSGEEVARAESQNRDATSTRVHDTSKIQGVVEHFPHILRGRSWRSNTLVEDVANDYINKLPESLRSQVVNVFKECDALAGVQDFKSPSKLMNQYSGLSENLDTMANITIMRSRNVDPSVKNFLNVYARMRRERLKHVVYEKIGANERSVQDEAVRELRRTFSPEMRALDDYSMNLFKDYETRSTFGRYTSELHTTINRILCGKYDGLLDDKGHSRDGEIVAALQTIHQMDRVFEHVRTPVEISVRRGATRGELEGILSVTGRSDLKELVGTSFVNPAYSSTSTSKHVAEVFIDDGGFMYNIIIEKGCRALCVMRASEYPDEQEVLIDRDSMFVVEDVETGGDYPVVTARCVPNNKR